MQTVRYRLVIEALAGATFQRNQKGDTSPREIKKGHVPVIEGDQSLLAVGLIFFSVFNNSLPQTVRYFREIKKGIRPPEKSKKGHVPVIEGGSTTVIASPATFSLFVTMVSVNNVTRYCRDAKTPKK